MNGGEQQVVIENQLAPDIYVSEEALAYDNEYEVGKDENNFCKENSGDDIEDEDGEFGEVEVEEEIVETNQEEEDEVVDESSNIKLTEEVIGNVTAEEVIGDVDDDKSRNVNEDDEYDDLGDSDEREMVVDEKAVPTSDDDDESQSQSIKSFKQEKLDELSELVSSQIDSTNSINENGDENGLNGDETKNDDSTHPHEAWSHFTGLKVKHFTPVELELFKKPFEMGWRREVVLRGTVTNSGKKIGDVYYFSPDKKVKLRSYVEMGLYLKKHQNNDLQPENFTFARQPIYKPPEEIVRHAMQRWNTQPSNPQKTPPTTSGQSNANSENRVPVIKPRSRGKAKTVSTPTNNTDHNFAATEPRSKRKRVAPLRFEDEDYSDQSPFKKRSRMDKLNILATAAAAATPSTISPSQTPAVTTTTPAVTTSDSSVSLQVTKTTPHMKVTLSNKASLLAQPVLFTKKGQTLLQVQSQPSQHLVVTGIQIPPQQTDDKQNSNNKQPQTQHNFIQIQPTPPIKPEPISATTTASNTSASTSTASSPSSQVVNPNVNRKSNQIKIPILKIKVGNFKSMKTKIEAPESNIEAQIIDTKVNSSSNNNNNNINNSVIETNVPTQPLAPCSIMCSGRRGTLPSLLCTRCLCLFHPECVSSGLHLQEPNRFVCPNCVQPGEKDTQPAAINIPSSVTAISGLAVTAVVTNDMNGALNNENDLSQNDVANKVNIKQANPKMRAFQPILPKPNGYHSQTQHKQQQQQQPQQQQLVQHSQLSFIKSISKDIKHLVVNTEQLNGSDSVKKFLSCPPVKVKLPAGTHLYRVQGPRAHQESIAPRGFKGLSNQAVITGGHRKNAAQNLNSHKNSLNQSISKNSSLHHSVAKLSSSSFLHPNPLLRQTISSFASGQKVYQQRSNQPNTHEAKTASKNKRNYKEYMRKSYANLNTLTNHYSTLNEILKQLTVRDLLKMKQASRVFNNLVSQAHLWDKIVLKGLKILDWQYLGRNIVEPYSSSEVNFECIRCSQADLVDVWRNFSSLIDYFKSVKVLKFGTIPSFVLEEIINAALTENCYNSFINLEKISVKNLINEDDKNKSVDIDLLTQLNCLPSLKSISIDCKQGFTVNDEKSLENLSKTFSSLSKLRTLILPCLRGLTAEQFKFLEKLTHLEHLEIGSCESWTTCEEDDEDENSFTKNKDNKSDNSNVKNENQQATADSVTTENTNENDVKNDNEMNSEKIETDKQSPMEVSVESKDIETNKQEEKATFQINEKRNSKGAFKYLKELNKLKKLKLVEIIIDETSNQWSDALKEMTNLESLSLETVTISPDATETLDYLTRTIKNNLQKLRYFTISTNDSHTNKCVYEFIKKLNNLNKIIWKVGALVEDSGQCFVPFLKERGDESDMEGEDLTSGEDHVEMMDMSLLSDLLQVALQNTQVIILPQ